MIRKNSIYLSKEENLMRIQELAGLLVIVGFQLIDAGVAGAQLPTDILKQMWSAQWITSPDGPQRD